MTPNYIISNSIQRDKDKKLNEKKAIKDKKKKEDEQIKRLIEI
jgi:hypothetical protein